MISPDLQERLENYVQSTSLWRLWREIERPLIIAHRGYAKNQEFEKNTLPAFKYALELESDGLECDLRVSKDGKIVVHHDAFFIKGFSLNRIAGTSYDKLVDLKNGKENIPTIDDLIYMSKLRVPLFLQIKDPNTTDYILAHLRSLDIDLSYFYIMGYMNSVINNSKNHDFNFGSHYLLPINWNIQTLLEKNQETTNIGIISPQYRLLTNSHLKDINKFGFMSFPFTINKQNHLAKYLFSDVTGIYTDNLEEALKIIT